MEPLGVLWQGIGVGIAVAAPVGPIGIVCIRRTLAHGRRAGLAAGLGATTADSAYGLTVAWGFAATGALVAHSGAMARLGGALIAALGASSGSVGGGYLLVLGVFLGSAPWWLCLVHVTAAVRTRMTTARVRWLDLLSGGVLLVVGTSLLIRAS